MISIRANERRDIGLGADGNLAFVTDLEAVIQNCVTAMSAQMGEMIYAMTDGVPTLTSIWDKYNPAQFEAAGRRTLRRVDGVQEVVTFTVTREGDTLQYSAVIKTIYGIAAISNPFFLSQ